MEDKEAKERQAKEAQLAERHLTLKVNAVASGGSLIASNCIFDSF
jgi:hypothetical protein